VIKSSFLPLPHPFQYLLLLVFFMITTLSGVRWGRMSMWFWFAFPKLFSSFAHLLFKLFFFVFNFLSPLYILNINCLLAIIFFPFYRLSFHFVDCFFCCEEAFFSFIIHMCIQVKKHFNVIHLSILALISWAVRVLFQLNSTPIWPLNPFASFLKQFQQV
jgi:hypothetical protein